VDRTDRVDVLPQVWPGSSHLNPLGLDGEEDSQLKATTVSQP
jgi:hypothetical protein